MRVVREKSKGNVWLMNLPGDMKPHEFFATVSEERAALHALCWTHLPEESDSPDPVIKKAARVMRALIIENENLRKKTND